MSKYTLLPSNKLSDDNFVASRICWRFSSSCHHVSDARSSITHFIWVIQSSGSMYYMFQNTMTTSIEQKVWGLIYKMSTNLHPPREIEELARGLAVSTLTKSYFRFASSTYINIPIYFGSTLCIYACIYLSLSFRISLHWSNGVSTASNLVGKLIISMVNVQSKISRQHIRSERNYYRGVFGSTLPKLSRSLYRSVGC